MVFAERRTCCEAVSWKAAIGRALLLSSQGTGAGRSVVAASFLAGGFYKNQILRDLTQQVSIWMQGFSAARGGVK